MNTGHPYEAASAGTMDDVANPYLAASAPPPPPPDLDAGAPSLRNAEQQRVNRKALMFLAGILLLLVMLAVLVFANATRKKDVEAPKDEQVSVPTLADSTPPAMPPMPHDAEPIDVQATPVPVTPPLPPAAAEPAQAAPYPMYPSEPAQASRARTPSLLERRMGATEGGAGTGAGGGDPTVNGMTADAYVQQQMAQMGLAQPAAATPAAGGGDRRTGATSAQFLRHPDALLVRGTYLRCVLESRIVTDIAGFTSCILAEPVYSINGRTLLLPRGSKIYGSYNRVPNGDRVEVVWDRITTPNGIDVSMASPGIDNLGGAGHPGERNAHWGSRITSALLVSLLSDVFKYEAAKHGPETSTATPVGIVQSPFESNTANTLDRLANQAAAEGMSRPPTVTINQGTVVTVYVAKDVDFSQVVGG